MRLTRMFALGVALASAASAQTTVVFWDFFGGGDGARMKQIVDDFNKSQKDIVVQRTTQTWGAPFYTKVHTAVVAGQTPDVMTYHLSHYPAGLAGNDLRLITPAEITAAGLKPTDFQKNLVNTITTDAKLAGKPVGWYGIPLDTHTFVWYQDKDALKKAGVTGNPGSAAAMTTELTALKDKAGVIPAVLSTNQDSATIWRLFYTLFLQQGGSMVKNGKFDASDLDTKGKVALQLMADWSKNGLLSKNTTYPAGVALFTAGRAATMFNGVWETPTMVDQKTKGTLKFDYGISAFPKLYANNRTWADSHTLAIPNNSKKPMDAAKFKAVMTFIAYVNKQGGMTWAGGGHIPAYLPTQGMAAFKSLQPNAQFSPKAAADATLEPNLPFFGVGGPVYDAVGNNFGPVLLGQLTVDQGIAKFKAALQGFAK